MVTRAVPFVIRHAANGHIEYVDPQSVPYLGYLPQDLADKDVLSLYHPEDLQYLRTVYDTIVKEEGMPKSKPYRSVSAHRHRGRIHGDEKYDHITIVAKTVVYLICKRRTLYRNINRNGFR